jgi:hypothetical protein
VALVRGDVLDVGVRSLVVRRPQPLRGRHLSRPLDGDHRGRLAGGLEDVDADRGVPGVAERLPDQGAHALAVQAGAERLAIGCLQSPQVQGQAACLAVAHLHRGEVAAGRDRRPELVRRWRDAVDLDVGHAARHAPRRVLSAIGASVLAGANHVGARYAGRRCSRRRSGRASARWAGSRSGFVAARRMLARRGGAAGRNHGRRPP